jgi:hypothetical protein
MMALAVINFISVLLYIITNHPQGIARMMSYIILIPISFDIMRLVYVIYKMWCLSQSMCL